MKLPAASTNRVGHPACAQRFETATNSSALSPRSGLPRRMYAVVFPVSPTSSTIVIMASL
jgi:hypothetical protein